ncbi:MAG: hypothetical protein ACK41D_00255 [Rubricoccaceae bacterium]
MPVRRPVRLGLLVGLGLLLLLALSDVLGLRPSERGVVSPLGYVEIPHGNHSHYVPNGWTGDPPISQFPTTPPPPGMTVNEVGQIVPLP